ncbi:biotin carboxylase N-terminal domain-containing protein [Pleionea sp. CnH1-48]|uniref:acetyl/propionyl/methylcrotonyl-CoA carboxylase subunit alpha n=1 Tax=Pleionea sp. CnH1-48 TaxID=2954494 RepID=UPI002096FFFE|nr:biotin carboxylase N-terminal domain-containing protein [Pleionea sp. CnH1-48]MCO7227290.1 ATP-grasp domain-containing protein [Pleionea sp. CnH1-48]
MSNFEKILIANRGEIAVRIMKTAQRMGFATVAVFSDADRHSPHVKFADEAFYIGSSEPSQSYLNIDKILTAAQETGADAIHPGYGFLSENPLFAKACAEHRITFIGPAADAIELMGSKRLSKLAVMEADVPCIPGYEGEDQSDRALLKAAEAMGYPIMIKASAGGGGRGMRCVEHADDMPSMLSLARSESLNAFGSDELILEKAIQQPRHIEFQIFADAQGNYLHLGERECSIQRRHQKIIEEAPSPALTQELREAMGQAAIRVAKSCQYLGAGTVEFLLDKNGDFYFLEMNTRLQVEHPVTEMIYGVDLVEWQLLVAQNQALPLLQEDLIATGHAIEARLYAEDPDNNFMPQTGSILDYAIPEIDGCRVDTGIETNSVISPFYDPMLGKWIAYGQSRQEATRKLKQLLNKTTTLGITSNQNFLHSILSTPAFEDGATTTDFLEKVSLQSENKEKTVELLAIGCLLKSPEQHPSTSSIPAIRKWTFQGTLFESHISWRHEGTEVTVIKNEETHRFSFEQIERQNNHCNYLLNNIRSKITFKVINEAIYLQSGAFQICLEDMTMRPANTQADIDSATMVAPMDASVIDILVNEGDLVEKGQPIAIIEAMKMEHVIKAGQNGTVQGLSISKGQQVKRQQLIASLVI